MAEIITIRVEANFSGSTWTDISSDVVGTIKIKRGIFGNGPFDRVAKTGSLKFQLNNTITNSGGKQGYYSVGHTDARSGFEIGLPIRVNFDTTYHVFRGRLYTANPDTGKYGRRRVSCVALDYMDIMASYKLEQLEVQASKRPDEVLATVVAALPIAPTSSILTTDPDTYTRALHGERDENMTARTIAQKLAVSSGGYVWISGEGVLRWQSRHSRPPAVTAATLDNTMTGLKVVRSQKNIYNTVRVVTHPVEVDSAATLYTSQREIVIQPGQSVNFVANYTTTSGLRVGGAENHVTPVAGTHYRASATASGSGGDLNSDCTVTVDWGANSAAVQIDNGSSKAMYVNLFNLVGDALLMYDPVTYEVSGATSQVIHGNRVLRYSMPYQDDPNVGVDFANHLLAKHKDPVNEITSVEFIANSSLSLAANAKSMDISIKIKIVETVTGIGIRIGEIPPGEELGEYFINGIEHTIYDNGIIKCRWILERSIGIEFWRLGIVGDSELGETTWLGY